MVVPSLMWVKALDMILDKLRVCGVDFSRVTAISGCAQVTRPYIESKIDYFKEPTHKEYVCLYILIV